MVFVVKGVDGRMHWHRVDGAWGTWGPECGTAVDRPTDLEIRPALGHVTCPKCSYALMESNYPMFVLEGDPE